MTKTLNPNWPLRPCRLTNELSLEAARRSCKDCNARLTDNWDSTTQVYRKTRNRYMAALCTTKAEHWKNWIENVDQKGPLRGFS